MTNWEHWLAPRTRIQRSRGRTWLRHIHIGADRRKQRPAVSRTHMCLQCIRDRTMNHAVQLRSIAPAHFRLLRMDIHIHSLWIDLNEQNESRLQVGRRTPAIRLSHCVL